MLLANAPYQMRDRHLTGPRGPPGFQTVDVCLSARRVSPSIRFRHAEAGVYQTEESGSQNFAQ